MSGLYNMLFGVHPASGELLRLLNLDLLEAGRFRDCFPSPDGTKIILYTRCGGGNRDDYHAVFENLRMHPLYIRDYDDDFDSTYASIEFQVPEKAAEMVKYIAELHPTVLPADRWKQGMADLAAGKKNAFTEKSAEVAKQLFEAIDKGQDAEISNPDGSVIIKRIK